MVTYDRGFYDSVNDAGATSARAVLPVALAALPGIRSAADIGCGTGIWARVLLDLGVPDVVAVDGDYVPHDQLRVDPSHFVIRDLAAPFTLDGTRDLVVCVEVAEHLPADRADGFVADLAALAPALIFSAATPGQGGTHHVNEQWGEYWVRRFNSHGLRCWDVLRPPLRYDRRVAWIYRQNLMLVLRDGHRAAQDLPLWAEVRVPEEGDVSFEYVARYLLERRPGLATTVRALPGMVSTALRRRLRSMT